MGFIISRFKIKAIAKFTYSIKNKKEENKMKYVVIEDCEISEIVDADNPLVPEWYKNSERYISEEFVLAIRKLQSEIKQLKEANQALVNSLKNAEICAIEVLYDANWDNDDFIASYGKFDSFADFFAQYRDDFI